MSIATTHKTHDRFATRSLDPSLSLSVHARPKYHLRAGTEYLHWSGAQLTSLRSQAWIGTVEQAKACKRTFSAAAGCKIRAIRAIPQHSEMEV